MTNTSDTPAEARPADPRRQHRIALANAHTQKLIRQRIGWFRARGFPADSVRPRAKGAFAHNSIALSVGVPIETVIDQVSEE